MNPAELLDAAAARLGELTEEVVFVGGATVGLWMTDPAAPPSRPTLDVDVIVEVATRAELTAFEERLRRAFREDTESGVICRWMSRDGHVVLDVMPTEARLLGFANRWQAEAFPHAVTRSLPSGRTIRAVSPPYLLATKIEAFRGRGEGDFVGSRDYADVIALLDGREELIQEVAASRGDLRSFLHDETQDLLSDRRAIDGIAAHLRPDPVSQDRADEVVVPRMREIVAATRG